jgi:hypothetical protein
MRKSVTSLIASAVLSSIVLVHAENAPVTAGESTDAVTGTQISGVSLVDVGAANISASGHVYNLKNLADFSGNYVAMTAGMTVAGGGSAAYLKNEHGVVIKLHSTDVGLRFNLSADGVKVKLAS